MQLVDLISGKIRQFTVVDVDCVRHLATGGRTTMGHLLYGRGRQEKGGGAT